MKARQYAQAAFDYALNELEKAELHSVLVEISYFHKDCNFYVVTIKLSETSEIVNVYFSVGDEETLLQERFNEIKNSVDNYIIDHHE